MASVNFQKLKGGDCVAMLRHSDNEERLKHEHSNKDINKEKTVENVNLGGIGYGAAKERFKARIKELDSTTNTNKRKDRVECFGLCMTVPLGLTREQERSFLSDAYELMETRFGADNCVNGYIHFDEVHDYLDHGELKTSRAHLHAYIIPEVEGKLNGKRFSSRANMQKLNKDIDAMCRERYGVTFLTHEEARKRTVEELKALGNDEMKKLEIKRSEGLADVEYLEGRLLRASEVKSHAVERTITGKEKSTIRLDYEEYASLRKTATAVEDAIRTKAEGLALIREGEERIKEVKEQEAALKRYVQEQSNKADAMVIEARDELERAAEYIEEAARRYADGRSKRLERLASKYAITDKDGRSISLLEYFNKRERSRQKEGAER